MFCVEKVRFGEGVFLWFSMDSDIIEELGLVSIVFKDYTSFRKKDVV